MIILHDWWRRILPRGLLPLGGGRTDFVLLLAAQTTHVARLPILQGLSRGHLLGFSFLRHPEWCVEPGVVLSLKYLLVRTELCVAELLLSVLALTGHQSNRH